MVRIDMPPLGQGTYRMGERADRRAEEVAALRLGLDLGMTLIDTAEMYASGGAEEVVGEAIAGRRQEVCLVSKVLPSNASRAGTIAACERSLRRLRVDELDLYLLHWPGAHALEDTIDGFEQLRAAGKIRAWGVSNFEAVEMPALAAAGCATNQVLYNLARRGVEWDMLPACRALAMPVMAYSPFEQARMLGAPVLARVAARHGATPAQVALAWLLRQPGVVVIPKAARAEHVRANAAAAELRLDEADIADLDRAFPPPHGPEPLAVL